MMKTRMCCSFWILVTAMLVWSTSGADGAQEKDNPKTLSPPSPSPSRPADLHGAGVHSPLHPPHLTDHEDFPGAPDRSPAGSAADDSPPLPDGFPPPNWQEKSPPYPDSSHPPEGPENVTPEGRDDAQPLPGRLPVGQRPKWRSSFPSVRDSLPPTQSYGKVQPRLGWYAPKTPDDFPSHKGRYPWRRHSDDYPAKGPYNFPSHAGRYPPETPHDFPPHQGRRPPEPRLDFPPESPLDFSPRQGRYPPDWPDSFPPFPDTPVQPERDLLSVLETHRQFPEPDYDGRQAVFPELSPLPGKRINPEENSQDRGPSSDHVEALMRRTLRREGRKRSRIRKLYKRLQRQKFPKNVRSSSKAQWPFHKNPFQQQLNLSRDDAGNVNHSRELNQHGQSDFTDESRKRAELDDFGKSAKTLTSSQQSEMSKGSMHNSRGLRQPLSPNVQQKNPAWKREPESRAEEKTAFDGLPQPFLDRKKAVSFLSRQPPPSKWRKWLNKLFKRDQKKRGQFNDAFSLHHVSHNTGDEDDNHDDDNDDDDGDGVTDHSDALFLHRQSYDIDGQGEVLKVWKDSDDKSESDSSDVGQRVPDQADKESREEMHRGRKTPAETDKPADSSDNDFPDNYQRDSNLGKNQNKNHELSKRSNSRKINRKKTELRKPRALNWHHRSVQRKRRPQRRLQHMLNRGRKARGPKNLLPKLRRPNFPKDVLSKWLTPRRRVPPNRKRQTAKRPLPSPVKRKPHKRFPVRQRIQNRHRTSHRPKSRSPCGRLLPRCSFPSNKRIRGKINGGRRRKAKWFARRRPSRRQRHRKKDPSRRGWLAGNKKKRVHKKDCDDKTPVSSTAKQNPTFTFSTTEPIFPQRGGSTTSLPETSTTKSPAPSEKDQGGEEGSEGLEPVRTVYLGAVEGPRLEAARVDVFRSGSNSSASSNSTPVFVRVNYKQQDQPLNSSAAGALERTKRNADDDQGNNGDDDSDDNENVTVSDDNDIRSQRRNRRRRMQRRRRERKRNRMNRLNRRRRLNNDGDDDADDISASSEDRQQGRRRGNYRQQRREGMNANVRDDDNDDSNDNDNDIEHNNDDDHDDNDVNNNIDQENDNDRDANDENDSNNNADNDEHDAATREEIRLNYRHQEREPTAIEVTVHDDENNDEDDNDEDDNDDRQNRVVGFVHLGPSSRRNRQRTDGSDHQWNQLINRNRRRRQRRLKNRRQRQRNRQRARQQRARLASSGDVRNAGNVSRESEPETPLSQVQAVSSDNGQGQGQGQQEAEAEAFIPSPFINHRTAYDFLSTQVRSRSRGEPGRGVNEQQAEHWQFNHRMSESMCEVFDKHFVPTTIGGRCV